MSERSDHMHARLQSLGADLLRWPDDLRQPAREALLSDPAFRAEWERERALDHALSAERDARDRELAASGAAARILKRLPGLADPLGGLRWRPVAAAMLVAAMLGGALDLTLIDRAAYSEREAEPIETVMLDPLAALEEPDIR